MDSTATALAIAPQTEITGPIVDLTEYFKPQLTVAEALKREQQLMQIIGTLLKPTTQDKWGNVNFDGADYGVIPGTKNRSLFQTGAEKLALLFGLTVTALCIEKQEDWEKGFFRYTYKATASFKGHTIREVTRTCHTREKKYAYVWVTRPTPPPDTQKEMLEEMKARWGSEWVNKQKTKVWQERRDNPDPWSLQFIVEAMAQKRAKVAAVKEALAATGYFSQEIDFEDFKTVINVTPEPIAPVKESKPVDPKRQTLTDICTELKAKGITQAQIKERADSLCDGNADFKALSPGDVDGLIEDFSQWLDSINVEAE